MEWTDKTFSQNKSVALTHTSIALHGCKPLTFTSVTDRHIQTFEIKHFGKILDISYIKHRTNDIVTRKGATNR